MLIALGVTGGIGAYKAVEVARGLQKRGHDVMAALLQPARDLDGLVGADSAGDAESDQHRLLLLGNDPFDLAEPDFLHREARLLVGSIDLGRAAALQLLRTFTRQHHEFELVHTRSFPTDTTNELIIRSTTGFTTRSRARSARTMDRNRSTHASSASLTMT